MERNVPNDFVSRYELVKHLVGVHDGWRIPFGYTVEDEIINFPAADVVEVRHGKWINERQEGLSSFSAECSLCGKRTLAYFHYFYCPNCGAVMDNYDD